jgi:serine/threonine protein kinase
LSFKNILLTRSGVAKLCDFEMLSHQGVVPDFSRGTRAYAAPELVRASEKKEKKVKKERK